jgi:SAM-dependent methyltransferase
VVRADARDLPVEPGFIDLVVAFDVLEYIEEDHLVMQEIGRVLRSGGGAALIAVSYDMALWSARDEAMGRVRRYSRESLVDITEKAGLVVDWMWTRNLMLRPVVALRHRASWRPRTVRGNGGPGRLSAITAAERVLPVRSLPGTSLLMRVHRE